jgi:hypothetical protein
LDEKRNPLVVPSITLERSGEARNDRLAKWRVLIDGESGGRIASGERKSFELQPGRHSVQLKTAWCRSRAHEVDLDTQETAEFWCEPTIRDAAPGVLGGLQLLRAMTLGRNEYIALERIGEDAK